MSKKLIDLEIGNELIKNVCKEYNISYGESYGGFAKAIATVFESAPTVDAEPVRHGKWDEKGACTVCGKLPTFKYGILYYCPNCGAKMDLEN